MSHDSVLILNYGNTLMISSKFQTLTIRSKEQDGRKSKTDGSNQISPYITSTKEGYKGHCKQSAHEQEHCEVLTVQTGKIAP